MKRAILLLCTIGIFILIGCKETEKKSGEEIGEVVEHEEIKTEAEEIKEKAAEKVWDDATEIIASDRMSSKQGKTSASGSYTITRVGQSVKLNMSFKAKKTGQSGTGKSSFAFVILNDDWEPLYQHSKGFTIGARNPQGVHRKKHNPPSITLTGPKAKKILNEGAIIAFNVNVVSDGIGIPTSLNEWKEDVIENLQFAKDVFDLIPDTQQMESKGWIFKTIGA